MSWGYRVMIIIATFVTAIITMVYISMRQTNEMVDANYYEREMKYENVISAKKNLQALTDTVSIKIEGQQVVINFPEASISKLDSGSIEFMMPSTSKNDKKILMQPQTGSIYHIPSTTIPKGWYSVRMQWSSNAIPYYHEQYFLMK